MLGGSFVFCFCFVLFFFLFSFVCFVDIQLIYEGWIETLEDISFHGDVPQEENFCALSWT